MVYGCPYVTINDFAVPDGKVMILTNYSNDAYENPLLSLGFTPAHVQEIGRSDGIQKEISAIIQGEEMILQTVLEPLTSRCIIVKS